MIDIAPLLTEAPEGSPCGPDLTYDPAYLGFYQLAQEKPEQQYDDKIYPAVEPPWKEVLEQGIALLARSKDLRVAAIVVRAWVHTEGFAGLSPGLHLTRELLARFGESIYPSLDPQDGNDPTIRINALAPISDARVLLRDLRDAALVRSRQHGQLLVRDVEAAFAKTTVNEKSAALSQAQVEAVLLAISVEDPQALPAVLETFEAAKALSAVFDEKFGPALAPDLKPLLTTLHALAQACGKFVNPKADPLEPVSPTQSVERADTEPFAGTIRSREDAALMIDKVVEYLESHEPTNPAPLLFKRGKRFMTMNFVEIFKEVSPDSVAKIDAIIGPTSPPS